MERNEMIDILNGMCERCLMKGIITTLDDAKEICEVFDRFRNKKYTNDNEYSGDIVYLYNLATKLHVSGNTSLEESYSIYSAILSADNIDFVETDDMVVDDKVVEVKPSKIKKSRKSKENNGVIDISDIAF